MSQKPFSYETLPPSYSFVKFYKRALMSISSGDFEENYDYLANELGYILLQNHHIFYLTCYIIYYLEYFLLKYYYFCCHFKILFILEEILYHLIQNRLIR